MIGLIAGACGPRKVEELLDVFIDGATFTDVAEIKAALSQQLLCEADARVRSNYCKALEFLD
jgi:hypothetical protein